MMVLWHRSRPALHCDGTLALKSSGDWGIMIEVVVKWKYEYAYIYIFTVFSISTLLEYSNTIYDNIF